VIMGDSAGGNVAVMSGIIAGNPHLIHYVTTDATLSQAKYPEIIKLISLYSHCTSEGIESLLLQIVVLINTRMKLKSVVTFEHKNSKTHFFFVLFILNIDFK